MKNNIVEEHALNWFVHVLTENIGRCEWVTRNPEEQEKYKKETGDDYPYKVIKHPIIPGKEIVLNDSKEYKIKCDSEYTRNLIIELARKYIELEKKIQHYRWEDKASEWHPISDLPPHHMASSRPDYYPCIVDSPILHYIEGVTMGFRRNDKWYIWINGKEVEHPVTHFRHIPPHATETIPYENVRKEVENLRKLFSSND